jgi:uncharacterized phage protein (TIGR02218 family)
VKQASPLTQSLLASHQLLYADLYTITLIETDPGTSMGGYGGYGGYGYGYGPPAPTQLFYTDADQNLVYNGNTYLCTHPAVSRTGTKCSLDLSVDTVEVSIFGAATDLVLGVPFPQFALNGGFDGATVRIDRCFMPSYGDTSAGVVNLFFGNVSEVKPSRSAVVLTVSSQLELLNLDMPRNLLSPGCIHALFDTGCTLIQADYAQYSWVSAASTNAVSSTNLALPSGFFTKGTILFTSGANAGATATIKQHTLVNGVNTFSLMTPLDAAPAVGENFTAFPGCDKTMATCQARFNNLANFRGWPFVPSPTAST